MRADRGEGQSYEYRGDLLIVDDDGSVLQILAALLEGEGYEVRRATSGRMALMFAREDPPELILLDIRLPDVSGLEVCRKLKEDGRTAHIPVIFISGLYEVQDKVQGFAAGGGDFISKPFQGEEVLVRVATHLSFKRLQGQIEAQNLRLQEEITKSRQSEEALRAANDKLEERVAERTRELMATNQRLVASGEALEERLRFERFLSEMSARFLNIAPEEIGREAEGALKGIVDFFRVSHCILIRGFPEERRAEIIHTAHADHLPPTPLGGNLYIPVPWTSNRMAERRTLCVTALEDLPAEAAADKEFYRNLGVRSFLILPIIIGDSRTYAIAISSRDEERVWPEDYLPRMKLLGEIVVNALERQEAESAAKEKSEELDQFFNVSLDILCIASARGGFLRVNPAAERILGYTREELMAARPIDFIHPEDLERTLRLGPILAGRQKVFSFANRFRCKDGTYRWLEWSAVQTGGLLYTAARDITDRRRTEEALKESEKRLRLLSSQLLAAQETERKRIANDLHDGLAAQLSAIKYRIEHSLKIGEAAEFPATLEETMEKIQTVLTETRRIVFNLRPAVLDDLGILPALSWYLREMGATYPQTSVEYCGNIAEEDVPEDLKIVVFRVVQESVNNAVRHGRPSQIKIGLEKQRSWLRLSIADNGHGFRSVTKSARGGIGLDSMQQRVESSGGIFSIRANPGEGTVVTAEWRAGAG